MKTDYQNIWEKLDQINDDSIQNKFIDYQKSGITNLVFTELDKLNEDNPPEDKK